jgi:hypothetical protein
VLSSASGVLITNTALDQDIPITALTYQLVAPPEGATIDPNGVISWSPPQNTGSVAYKFQTVVTDNGAPRLSATNFFRVSITTSVLIQPAVTLSLKLTNGVAVLSWASQSGQSYRIQYCDSLASAWSNSTPDVIATNTTTSVTTPVSAAPARMFRLQQL